MMTRRDALMYAATVAASRGILPGPSAVEAAAIFDSPAERVHPETASLGVDHPAGLYDPTTFAHVLDTRSPWGDALSGHLAPELEAEYVQARAAVLRQVPILEGLSAWHDMDEASFGWSCRAYMEGVAAGAAYENLRRALVGPVRGCARCWGVGSLGEGGRRTNLGGVEPCPDCKGAGTVPVPAPAIAGAASAGGFAAD